MMVMKRILCPAVSVIVANFPKERYSHVASNSLIKIKGAE